MKKLLVVFSFIFITLVVTACDGGNGPADVAQDFTKALTAGEVEEAMSYMSSEINALGRDKVQGILTMTVNQARREGALGSITTSVIREEIDGDIAMVTLEVQQEGEHTDTTDFDLIREEGEWRISMGDMGDK